MMPRENMPLDDQRSTAIDELIALISASRMKCDAVIDTAPGLEPSELAAHGYLLLGLALEKMDALKEILAKMDRAEVAA